MRKKISASEEVIEMGEVSSCADVKCVKIAKLDVGFQSADLNKVVEKINEIIEHKCQ